MTATAYLNHRFKPDDGTLNPGSVVAAGSTQFYRHSFVQLGGGFGEVRLGRYLPPLQELNGAFDVFGTDTVGSTHTQGINAGARYNNIIEYRSPKLGGVQVLAMYATREDNVNNAPAGSFAPEHPTGLSARYTAGPVDAAVAWDRNGLGQKTIGVYGAYDFGAAVLQGQFEKGDVTPGVLPVNNSGAIPGAGVTSAKRWSVSTKIPVGVAVIKAGYLRFVDEQARKIGVGVDYNLSKRTNLYSDLGKMSGDNPALTEDNKKTRLDVGIWHRF